MPALDVAQQQMEEEARRRALMEYAEGMDVAPVPADANAEAPEELAALAPSSSRATMARGSPQTPEAEEDPYGDALAESARRRFSHTGSDLGRGILEAFTGIGSTADERASRAAFEQAPIAEFLQRQKMADDKRRFDLTAQKALPKPGKVATGKPVLSNDPASPESMRYREAFRAQYPGTPEEVLSAVTEANYDAFRKSLDARAGINSREKTGADATAQHEKDREQRAEQFAATMRYKWSDMSQDERLALMRLMDAKEARDATAATAAAKKEEGQTLPAGEAASLGQTEAALSALVDLDAAHEAMGGGIGGTLGSLIPASQAKLYEDKVLATAQAVGTILEGGKLAAGDEVKYRKMLPDVGDSPDRRKAKIANVTKLLAEAKRAKVEGFGKAGFNVKGFTPKPATPKAAPSAPTGKVRVQKGSEVLEIDAADLKAAQADGYAKVSP